VEGIVILGAGGTAKDVIEILKRTRQRGTHSLAIVGLLDDKSSLWGQTVEGYPVLGPLSLARELSSVFFVNALSSIRTLRKLPDLLAELGIGLDRFLTLVDPEATVFPSAILGKGSIVYPGARILSRAEVGALCTILSNAVINHEAHVGSYSVLTSNVSLSGRVQVGEGCYLGSGCVVREDTKIGEGAIVGMGSVVIRDVPPKTVVVGNPAQVLRKLE
jgi:sugar O-acyltransferase (sialic acid O-acetyltransferase NeuD family)